MHNFRVPSSALAFSENLVSDKIQLFRTGTFHHQDYGQFKITSQTLAEIKKNFDQKVRGIDIAVDYRHENEDIAAAWFKELELSDDGQILYGKVEWTPRGKKTTEEKEFRYISPEFHPDYQDNETLKNYGPTLMGAALTNRPVIKKMEPVVELTELKYDANLKPEIKKGEIKMSPEELQKLVDQLKAENAELKSKLEGHMANEKKYQEEKVLAEKKAAFAKLLTEGKAVAAQEESYLKGDMNKFIELQQSVKLTESGSGGSGKKDGGTDGKTVDEKIHALAETMMKENKTMSLSEAYQKVLRENEQLRKEKYASH